MTIHIFSIFTSHYCFIIIVIIIIIIIIILKLH